MFYWLNHPIFDFLQDFKEPSLKELRFEHVLWTQQQILVCLPFKCEPFKLTCAQIQR